MKPFHTIALLLLSICLMQELSAQKTPVNKQPASIQKNKLPVLVTHLGPIKDSMVTLSANLVKSIIDARLVITDDKMKLPAKYRLRQPSLRIISLALPCQCFGRRLSKKN